MWVPAELPNASLCCLCAPHFPPLAIHFYRALLVTAAIALNHGYPGYARHVRGIGYYQVSDATSRTIQNGAKHYFAADSSFGVLVQLSHETRRSVVV